MPKIENSISKKETPDFTLLHPEFSIFVHKEVYDEPVNKMAPSIKTEKQAITPDMTIGEVVEKWPQLADIMLQHGLHCIGCHANPYETLEQGSLGHGISREVFDDMMQQLNEAVKNTRPVSQEKLILIDMTVKKAKEMLHKEKKEGYGLRVRVVPGGCAGMSYEMTFDKPQKDDELIEKNGLKVFVDNVSFAFLKGARIDYAESLQGAGFKIDNPNAKSTCGCGHSFG